MTGLRVALALAPACMLAAGCVPRCPEGSVPLERLVSEYNANAARVPRLWAQAKVRLALSDQKGRSFGWGSASALAPANALLRMWKEPQGPANFVLVGREVTDLFRLGVDAAGGVYYLWYSLGSGGQAWFGRTELAGAPGIQDVPIDPLQLAEILCLTELPDEPGKLPAVAMTMETDPCAYVLRYLKCQPVSDKLKVWREVWFRWDDRLPRRPYRIRLFDADGRCRVIAELGQYKPVEWDGPEKDAPLMPTDFRIQWPAIKGVQTAASIHMTLSGMSTTRPFQKSYFDFESHLPPGLGKIQVDAGYRPMDRLRKAR
ncbi:MAG: hypothetical protein AMJ81_07085 [Phycisphaerae bacterium SM23_33]|nr:MAG: hypothetical protein AMJ81_07085 [Phycisphaerae bacterium SM23_33]